MEYLEKLETIANTGAPVALSSWATGARRRIEFSDKSWNIRLSKGSSGELKNQEHSVLVRDSFFKGHFLWSKGKVFQDYDFNLPKEDPVRVIQAVHFFLALI